MSSVTRTTSNTIVSLLSTVQVTAERTGELINTVGIGIDMMSAYANKMSKKQQVSDLFDMDRFTQTIGKEMAAELTEHELAIAKRMSISPEVTEAYNANIARLSPLMEKANLILAKK